LTQVFEDYVPKN